MLWIIAFALIAAGSGIQLLAGLRAQKKLLSGEVDVFGDLFGAAGKSMGDFAGSKTPSEALGAGLTGMAEMTKETAKTQRKVNKRLWKEQLAGILGKAMVAAGVIILIVKIILAIVN